MEQTELIKTIVDTLNSVTKSSYKASTKSTISHIKARLKEGFNVDDFRHVICFKNEQWGSDDRMMEYLRPDTLFGTKFESYLQAALRVAQPAAPRKSEFVQ